MPSRENVNNLWRDLTNGLWNENPVFRLVLGMCPTLAVTNAALNGLAMGLATSFVLIFSEIIISLAKNLIPSKVRIPSYIIVIATFVTIADYGMKAFYPDLAEVLGLFIPLIVVNCLILGRNEAFASKNSVVNSIMDAVGMGLGFTWALTLLGAIREILGMGTIFGKAIPFFTTWWEPWTIMVLPAGAFLTLGVLLGIMNYMTRSK
ncbi:electron transport complex subunit RsxE [Anoxybacter fermentans]|uniref:Ion-translocating oxidoreductase complex subunit E n=1 Tax=Anoxybacter fermentans TaxID=1323375 RepID=A0A3Q9HQJ3_9FIRM|nr:electron transport complex subunit E [Anoxybacter fermentans]AZR73297.1 electron transport complex subunit RsxE [Anoxybacter fermentans]